MEAIKKISLRREERRTVCLACGGALSEPLLTLSDMPESAQHIPLSEELSKDRGITLRLCACEDCGLLQFDCAPVDYYRDVIRAVGLSETMRALRRADYRHMLETYGLSGKKFLECGCGRGEFLEVLKEFPARIYATEANAAAAASAKALLGPDCTVLHTFPETAEQRLSGAPFDCFFSFNFLEHQPDPSAMLGCMYYNLAPGGYGLITVPSFEYIEQDGRYYELIRDHIANYTLKSLSALVRGCGFDILESGRIGIGDTLRLVVQKPKNDTAERAVHRACAGILEAFSRKRAAHGDVEPLRKNYEKLRGEMAAYVAKLRDKGLRLALFGAGHQGFTIASTTALKDYAAYMVDSAPFKQGRFAPASHIPIVPPEYFASHPVDVVMVTAPGYAEEITAKLRAMYPEHKTLRICTIEPESWERTL